MLANTFSIYQFQKIRGSVFFCAVIYSLSFPMLFGDLLDKLRLVNRSNLGVSRIYKSLLIEGKEPPQYNQIGELIELTMMASSLLPAFRQFIKRMNEGGAYYYIDKIK